MKFIATISLLAITLCIRAQGEIDIQDKIFYRNERTFGALLNSNGFGGNFRYGKRVDAFKKTLYEIELNYLKHPKEVRVTTEYSSRSFIYGKLNSVYTLKGAFGVQNEMFQKRDQGGISIRYFYNFGPTFAFMKPIYYDYQPANQPQYYEKFIPDPAKTVYIVGKAPIGMGINELKIQPGIYGKFGFTFEYSKIDEVFHAFEIGVAFDAYIGKVPIMATSPGKLLFVLPDDQFYLTLFISYRFGRVIDTRFNQRRNKVDRMLTE